jgi:thiamine biosynthesis lipoprotein
MALVYLLSAGAAHGQSIPLEGNAALRTFSFTTMTTEAHVILPSGSSPPPEVLFALARDAALETERLMSPSGEASDVARFNAAKGGEWIVASPLTLDVLDECTLGHEYSLGAFDPTVGSLKSLFVFAGDELQAWPSEERIRLARDSTGFGGVKIDRSGLRIFKPKDGMKIDLGAAAKGYAVDRALGALKAAGAASALVEIGGEVGTLGLAPKNVPWRVQVEDPRSGGQRLAFELSNSAAATSGGKVSYFTFAGRKYTHIIDPRSGTPVPEGTLQVTVAHPSSCLAADVMSTSLFVLGPDGVKPALEAYVKAAQENLVSAAGLEAVIFYMAEDGVIRIRLYGIARDGSVSEIEAAPDVSLHEWSPGADFPVGTPGGDLPEGSTAR